MTSGVYCIRNIISGKIYIGSSVNIEFRWLNHQSGLKNNKHHSIHLQQSWNKYGENNFELTLLEICPTDMLIIREQAWINYYDSSNQESGYNISKIAGSCLGVKRSEETKRKLSIAHKGHKLPIETRIRMSREAMGHHVSEEARRKMSEKRMGKSSWNKGKKMSDETRKKMSFSKKLIAEKKKMTSCHLQIPSRV